MNSIVMHNHATSTRALLAVASGEKRAIVECIFGDRMPHQKFVRVIDYTSA